MPQLTDAFPKALKPFRFHGVDLSWREGEDEARCDCVACGAEAKMSVSSETSQWHCWVCGEKGNSLEFLRLLWRLSVKSTGDGQWEQLASDRGLLDPATCTAWGAAVSLLTGEWLLPGWDASGKLCQLYRWAEVQTSDGAKRRLLATPEHQHGLFTPGPPDASKAELWVCEGPWDAMALWEVLGQAKRTDEGLEPTGAVSSAILAQVNVVAAPGANVWHDAWSRLARDKAVTLLYDNDHPRANPSSGKVTDGAGLAGMRRTASLLCRPGAPPSSISRLQWGSEGWDPERPSGFDVRDAMGRGELTERIAGLGELFSLIQPAPNDWTPGGRAARSSSSGEGAGIRPAGCTSWQEVLNDWRLALHMRPALEQSLATMLAVALSTDQEDDQLCLYVIGDAGSAKTRLCDAMLVSRQCVLIEHLNSTGFHSGWKDESGEDFALLSRVNHKTMVTPEGDTLVSSPYFGVVMSQMRRIFDGSSAHQYGNRKEAKSYEGLRTPWIIAGTPYLMDHDQSRQGDRFLRVIVDPPDEEGRQEILRRAGFSMFEAVGKGVNGSVINSQMLSAYQRTAGYVDFLRSNADRLLGGVVNRTDGEWLISRCSRLAEFTAFLIARPAAEKTPKAEKNDTVELPSRLVKQFVRLSVCLAAVLNRPSVDEASMSVARKVSLDTAKGRTMSLARLLASPEAVREGMSTPKLAGLTGRTDAEERHLLMFLNRINVVKRFEHRINSVSKQFRWRLTDRMLDLWRSVVDA